jgi:maltooligosyltrehalose trehalohydrolase
MISGVSATPNTHQETLLYPLPIKDSLELILPAEVSVSPRGHLGASQMSDSTVEFLVWAPRADRVEAHILGADEQLLSLERQDQGYFKGVAEVRGADYLYLFRLNGELERPDPASRLQPQGVHGPSCIVTRDFSWTDSGWRGLRQEDYIFYELHVGTYTSAGTFEGVASRLQDLRNLGITAIELMPVAQFPGERNWGYDGAYPFAVQASYGGPLGLKQLVDAAHGAGLAVVLDVVYNHLGPEGSYLADFGPYFTDRYRTPWGSAINFDGPQSDPVVRYFVENALQWLNEFHIDALRLDAIHGIIDRNAQPFLALLTDAVGRLAREQERSIYLFAESDLNDARFATPPSAGGIGLDGQWSDDFHHALHSLQTGERTGYYADFGSVHDLAKAIREGFVFQGQFSKYRQRRQGNSSAALAARQFVVCSQNHDQVGNRMLGERTSTLLSFEEQKLSATVVLLSPYLPLLFMGEEFGEPAPFLYFTSHGDPELGEAVRRGRRKEFAAFAWQGEPPDPQAEATFLASKVDHDRARRPPHGTLLEFYRRLIGLRKAIPALRELDKNCVETRVFERSNTLCVRRWHEGDEIVLVLNFSDTPAHLPSSLPAGNWRKLIDSAGVEWLGPGSSIPESLVWPASCSAKVAPKSACVLRRPEVR